MLYTNKAKLYQCSGSPLPFHECTSYYTDACPQYIVSVAVNSYVNRYSVVYLLLCLGGRSHEAYSSRVVCVCHYASVGGATRHTVIALSVILSVCQSVCYTIFAAHAER